MLTQREFAKYVAANGNFTINDAYVFVPAVFDALVRASIEYGGVAIPKFGQFSVKSRKGYTTHLFGEGHIEVPQRYALHYSPAPAVKEMLNQQRGK